MFERKIFRTYAETKTYEIVQNGVLAARSERQKSTQICSAQACLRQCTPVRTSVNPHVAHYLPSATHARRKGILLGTKFIDDECDGRTHSSSDPGCWQTLHTVSSSSRSSSLGLSDLRLVGGKLRTGPCKSCPRTSRNCCTLPFFSFLCTAQIVGIVCRVGWSSASRFSLLSRMLMEQEIASVKEG